MSAYAESMSYGVMTPVAAPPNVRTEFLKKVAVKVLGSLAITAVASVVWMAAIATVQVLTQQWIALGIMLGGIYGAQFIGNRMTASPDATTRIAGFVAGSVMQGMALAYILGAAALMSASVLGSPLTLIGQAGGLVFLTVLGMVAYLWSGPEDLSLLRSALSVLFLPMLGLMAIGFFFPVGGTLGLVFAAFFVVVSAGALLYSLNTVMHRMSVHESTAGAFYISTSIVVLFWNVLSLLMRLTSRR